MNPVSLYITTSRLVFQSGCGAGGTTGNAESGGGAASSTSVFKDLNRLLPYLRKSLSCAVCCRLLLEPHTPAELNCQHHVCRGCVGERKKLKPSCGLCKDYNQYVENTQLRMLLQCYKSICEYIKTKPFFAEIRVRATGTGPLNGVTTGQGAAGAVAVQVQPQNINAVPSNLWELIEEGARFQDNYRCNSGLTKSAYSILPAIYPAPEMTVSSTNAKPIVTGGGQQLTQQKIITSNSGDVQKQAKVLPVMKVVDKSNYAVSSTSQISVAEKPLLHVQSIINRQQKPQLLTQQQTQMPQQQLQHKEIKFRPAPIKTVSNGSTMYSVLYAGNGNKITIKRKADPPHVQRRATLHTLDKEGHIKLAKTIADNSSGLTGFKLPQTSTTTMVTSVTTSIGAQQQNIASVGGVSGGGSGTSNNSSNSTASSKQNAKQLLKRRGCRCGNATATPGKLTCCGQRCPCYVDSKSCIDCKCRGCRNPHRADGMKVRPHIPELQNLEINLHNANVGDSLTTATTTILAPQSTTTAMGGGIVGSGGGANGPVGLLQPTITGHVQPQSSGLTISSTGGNGLGQINLGGTGSTLKITPTSIANVLNSTNQIVATNDGMDMGPSGALLDASGFSYLTPVSLDTSGVATTTVSGGSNIQYTMPGGNLANGNTIHVVGLYTTHLGDVSCSPTLSNMIRTDSALNSLLTHKPPDALLTQTSLNTLSLSAPTTLLGHSLFNPTTTIGRGGSPAGLGSSASVVSTGAGLELAGIGDGSGIDISDQLDLTGSNLITIDGALDDRLHADDV